MFSSVAPDIIMMMDDLLKLTSTVIAAVWSALRTD